jgi:hypothetical protein
LPETPQTTEMRHYAEKIEQLHGRKMLRLPEGMTNTSLKMAYGAANLDIITEYEENLFKYISGLNDYASALFNAELYNDAARILDECVKAGSDVFVTYKLLADIYAVNGDESGLRNLSEIADCLSDVIKGRVVTYVKNKLSQQNGDNG